jgi:uncharacterized protein YdeI (YjbR/CyaY-like superfamily)
MGGRIGSTDVARIDDFDDPVSPDGKEVFLPSSRSEWRRWLASNSERQGGLWIVYRKKTSSLDGPIYDDLVEEALCFGWIDSRVQRVDDDRLMQWFSPRRSGGIWSAVNKERVAQLIAAGHMTERGQAAIDQAKADGSWFQLDDVDALIVPPDLRTALQAVPDAGAAYEALSNSAKKQYLWWIHSAKRPATRTSRIDETIRRLSSEGGHGSS